MPLHTGSWRSLRHKTPNFANQPKDEDGGYLVGGLEPPGTTGEQTDGAPMEGVLRLREGSPNDAACGSQQQ
jgi:hypothetical protein